MLSWRMVEFRKSKRGLRNGGLSPKFHSVAKGDRQKGIDKRGQAKGNQKRKKVTEKWPKTRKRLPKSDRKRMWVAYPLLPNLFCGTSKISGEESFPFPWNIGPLRVSWGPSQGLSGPFRARSGLIPPHLTPSGPCETDWCRGAKIAARQFLSLTCLAITLTTGLILKEGKKPSLVGERQFGRHFRRQFRRG